LAIPVIPVSLLTAERFVSLDIPDTLESGTVLGWPTELGWLVLPLLTVEPVSVVVLGEPTVGVLAVSAPVTAPLSMDESRGCCCCAEAPEAAPTASRPAAERVMHWERNRIVKPPFRLFSKI
jgi:hypothetical protein